MKKEKNKKKLSFKKILPYIILFAVGFFVFSYPFISNFYYSIESHDVIKKFDEGASKLTKEEIENKIELARAYNRTIDPKKLHDPFTDMEKAGIKEYARMLEINELMGHVEIPKIDVNLPIYAGTTEEVLGKGAGHLEGSSLPVGGENTHTVITAHRGLAQAVMFRQLDKLKVGDVFYITNLKETMAYEVDKIVTIAPTDFSHILVVPNKDYATLLTCTPYMINSHRLLVRGHRIEFRQEVKEKEVKEVKNKNLFKIIIIIALIVGGILLFIFFIKRRKKKKDKNV